MVDFQSRDTRRDRGLDDEDDEEPDQTTDEDHVGDEPTDDSERTADDHAGDKPTDEEPDRTTDEDNAGDEPADEEPDRSDEGDHAGDEPDHDHHAHDLDHLGIAVVTISSSRSIEDDTAGDRAIAAIEDAGHEIPTRELLADDYDGIQGAVDALVGRSDVDAVITAGGTGVTPDDVTVEAVEPLFDKRLPGFGELFRTLSREEIGTRVVGTRAIAGIADGVPVFCLPGSENAVALGVEEIILPEVGHLAGLARR